MKEPGKKRNSVRAEILMLIILIAVVGAAYMGWLVLKLSRVVVEGPPGDDTAFSDDCAGCHQWASQNTLLRIDSVRNASDALHLAVRNAGTYDMPASDLDNSSVYIDDKRYAVSATAAAAAGRCSYDEKYLTNGAFYADSVIELDCGQGSYPALTGASCPNVTVEFRPPYGRGDSKTYRCAPAP